MGHKFTIHSVSQNASQNSMLYLRHSTRNNSMQDDVILCEDISLDVIDSNKNEEGIQETKVPKEHLRHHCNVCDLNFLTVDEVEQHLGEKHRPSLICDFCKLSLKSVEEMDKHFEMNHMINLEINCDASKLSEPQNVQHSEQNDMMRKEVEVACRKCKFKCKTMEKLDEHMESIHGRRKTIVETFENIVELKCRKCDYEGNSEEEIAHHMENTHMFNCKKCQFISNQEEDLKTHDQAIHQVTKIDIETISLEKHEEVKKVACEKCEYKCKLNIELRNHKKRKHTNEEEHKYQCNFCEFQSNMLIKMCEHKLINHPEVDPEFNPKSITAKEMILNLIAEQTKDLVMDVLEIKKYVYEAVTMLSKENRNEEQLIATPSIATEAIPVKTMPVEVPVLQPAPSALPNVARKVNKPHTRKNTGKHTKYLKKPKILIVGDSITHNANFANIERDTTSRIKTTKAFSSINDSRARWPHKNHTDVTEKALKTVHEGDDFEYLVMGAPTVDISNIDTSRLTSNDNTEVYEQNIITSCHNIFAAAHKAIENNPNLQKVVITEHTPRYDEHHVDPTGLKHKLARFANTTFHQMRESSEYRDKIVIGEHGLLCVGDQFEARYRDEKTNKYDGVHMYGTFGMRAYTRSLTRILQSVLSTIPSNVSTTMAPINHTTCPQAKYQHSSRYAVSVQNRFSILGN